MLRNGIWDQTGFMSVAFLETEKAELKITTFAPPKNSDMSLQN